MAELSYLQDIRRIENSIAEISQQENEPELELLVANINCLYGLILTRAGPMPDVFPINSPERAMRFLIYAYSLNVFNIGSSILDMLLNGRYTEAGALIRSLIENVAFAEYYSHRPDSAMQITSNVESLPTRTAVFRHLSSNGNWPKGGPRASFERYNLPAHGHIAYALSHIAETSGSPQATYLTLRRYSRETFLRLSRAFLVPMFGIQQVFRTTFIQEDDPSTIGQWRTFWDIGHNRNRIRQLYPGILDDDSAYESTETHPGNVSPSDSA